MFRIIGILLLLNSHALGASRYENLMGGSPEYDNYFSLKPKLQDAKFKQASTVKPYQTMVDRAFSDQEQKLLEEAHELLIRTLKSSGKDVESCVNKRMLRTGETPTEGKFTGNRISFNEIKSPRDSERQLTSTEMISSMAQPSGHQLRVIKINNGVGVARAIKDVPDQFIVGFKINPKYFKTPSPSTALTYAQTGSNADLTNDAAIVAVKDKALLAGLLAHEMSHNYGLGHLPSSSNQFYYSGEFGYCVTLLARRNQVTENTKEANPRTRPKSTIKKNSQQ